MALQGDGAKCLKSSPALQVCAKCTGTSSCVVVCTIYASGVKSRSEFDVCATGTMAACAVVPLPPHSMDTCVSSKAKPDPHVSTSDERNAARPLFELAGRLGMRSEALPGWSNIHTEPRVAASCCTLANFSALIMNTCFLSIASRPLRWDHHAPVAVYAVCHLTSALMLWIHGPDINKSKAYYALVLPAILIQIGFSSRLMVGPIQFVPFGHRLTFVLTSAVRMWCWAFAATLGAWDPDSPPHPHACASLSSMDHGWRC